MYTTHCSSIALLQLYTYCWQFLGVAEQQEHVIGSAGRKARRMRCLSLAPKKLLPRRSKLKLKGAQQLTQKLRRKYTSCISTTPTIKTRLDAAFQIMTDVAAVVAAAAGNRGIGFQGKLVSFIFFCACHICVPTALVLNR